MNKIVSALIAVAMIASFVGDDCCRRLEAEQMVRRAAQHRVEILEAQLAEEKAARRIAEAELERQQRLVRQLQKQVPAKTPKPKKAASRQPFELTRVAGDIQRVTPNGSLVVSISVKLRNTSGKRVDNVQIWVGAYDADGDLIRLMKQESLQPRGVIDMIARDLADGAVRVFHPWLYADEYERLSRITLESVSVRYAPAKVRVPR